MIKRNFRSILFHILALVDRPSSNHGALMFHGFKGNGFAQTSVEVAYSIIDLLARNCKIDFSITYDDAYDDIEPVLEYASNLRINQRIFVPTGLVGQEMTHGHVASKSTLTRWQRLPNLQMGSHGHTHTNFTRLNKRDLRIELLKSKEIIESITGKECQELAYPRGKYSDLIIEEVSNLGYRQAWTTNKGLIKVEEDNLSLPRIPIHRNTKVREVLGEFTRIGDAINQKRTFK